MKDNNKNLNTIQQQLNTPKTYEQFVLEQSLTDQQDLYPDLVHEDVSSSRGYGPMDDSAPKKGYYFWVLMQTDILGQTFTIPDRFMSPEELRENNWERVFPGVPRPAFYHPTSVSITGAERARLFLQMLESGEARVTFNSDTVPGATNSAKNILRDALRRHNQGWEVFETKRVK